MGDGKESGLMLTDEQRAAWLARDALAMATYLAALEPYSLAEMDRDMGDALDYGPRGHWPKVRVTVDRTR